LVESRHLPVAFELKAVVWKSARFPKNVTLAWVDGLAGTGELWRTSAWGYSIHHQTGAKSG